FQSSESFLAAALYDASINTKDTQYLTTDLTWLSAANVIWKNDVTEQWTLAKDSGVDVEALIAEKLNHFSGRSIETLFNNYPEIQADLLPFLGVHNLDPSDCGIVRSYDVSLLTPPFNKSQLETKTAILSARVFLVLGKEAADIKIAQEKIADISATALYFWLPLAGVRGETITQNGKTFKLGGLLCRYLALDLLLKEKTATENLRRQLQAKWEKSRDDCLDILQRLFGRKGLENGKTKIFKSGQLDALCCKSWHDLRRQLTDNIQQFYSKEIPIYAMNLNGLNDELYTGKSKTLKIVERLLAFKSNPTYQTDLLGENDTSELAALIDGVLGANQLFIESAEGWKIKNKGEAVGAIQTVLKIIHDALLHKRNTPYLVSELRTKLMAPPYGLPSCTLAILAAVAIRDEVPRLRWGNCSKELDFAKNLNSAFTKNSQLTIRLFDFTPEQLAVLFAIGLHFKIPKKDKSNEGYIVECCHKLRSFIKNQPESVKNSSNLLGKSRQLVNFFKQVGTNSKDLATCLVELLNAQTDVDKALVELKVLLEAFEKIANMKAYEVKTTWKDIIPTTIDNKQILISNLTHENASSDAKEIGNLLSKHEEDTKIDANKLTEIVLNKPIDQCSDSEIGQYKGKIETLIEYHQQLPQEIIAHKSDPITTEDDFIHQIEQICNRTTLSDEIMRSTLKTILSKHSDK
ncbi:MAG: hypothetical protein KAG10_07085, partial [Methylococcales bacterium]|nr:hypothetical protein [Methylococcales bacterium]